MRRIISFFCICIILLGFSFIKNVSGADWAQWRGPEQTGATREKAVVTKWSLEGENLLWKNPVGGRTTPLVVGDRLYYIGPMGEGHLGDLPRVDVAADGSARASLTAPRIKDVAALKGKTLMLHAGGDNYSDTPPLGGGGARYACGVLE